MQFSTYEVDFPTRKGGANFLRQARFFKLHARGRAKSGPSDAGYLASLAAKERPHSTQFGTPKSNTERGSSGHRQLQGEEQLKEEAARG